MLDGRGMGQAEQQEAGERQILQDAMDMLLGRRYAASGIGKAYVPDGGGLMQDDAGDRVGLHRTPQGAQEATGFLAIQRV